MARVPGFRILQILHSSTRRKVLRLKGKSLLLQILRQPSVALLAMNRPWHQLAFFFASCAARASASERRARSAARSSRASVTYRGCVHLRTRYTCARQTSGTRKPPARAAEMLRTVMARPCGRLAREQRPRISLHLVRLAILPAVGHGLTNDVVISEPVGHGAVHVDRIG